MLKICLFISLFLLFPGGAFAQNAKVQATVGEFYLDLSGFSSPNASIVLYSQEQFLRSSLADGNGDFFISSVVIKEGFSSFCLESVDFRRVGSSYTCFNIPPATGSVSKKDIFLPPTIGVSGRQLLPGASLSAFGYTMPSAKVLVHLGEGIILETTADDKGYYSVEIKDLEPGKYSLFATATYQGKDSEKPSRTLEIEALSRTGAVKEQIEDQVGKLTDFLLSFIRLLLRYIWLVLPILILVIILLLKKLRDRSQRVFKAKRYLPKEEEEETMHHFWFLGY